MGAKRAKNRSAPKAGWSPRVAVRRTTYFPPNSTYAHFMASQRTQHQHTPPEQKLRPTAITARQGRFQWDPATERSDFIEKKVYLSDLWHFACALALVVTSVFKKGFSVIYIIAKSEAELSVTYMCTCHTVYVRSCAVIRC